MQAKPIRRVLGLVSIGSLLFLNAACAIVEPYASAQGLSSQAGYESVKTKAVAIAADMENNIDDLERFDLFTGLVMVGAGIAGTSFAAFDGGRDAIVASGVVGGSALGLRAFLPFQPRKEIYLRGSAAIQCSIAATSFGVTVTDANTGAETSTSLQSLSGSFSSAVAAGGPLAALTSTLSDLQGDLARLAGVAPSVASMAALQVGRLSGAVVAVERAATDAAKVVNDAAKDRAVVLEMAVRAAVLAVNGQIMKNRLDPDGALSAASKEIDKVLAKVESSGEKLKDRVEMVEREADTTKAAATAGDASAAVLDESSERKTRLANAMSPGNLKTLLTDDAAAEKSTASGLRLANETMRAKSEEASDIANQINEIAEEMLRLAGQAKACFKGLL